MFLRYNVRRKDGKEHRYGSIVENRRVSGGRTVQRQVLYLGEINDSQKAAWCRTIEAFDEAGQDPRQIALFPEDRPAPVLDCDVVHVRLSGSRLHRPRQWGACWLACHLWDQLRLDDFWSPRLPASRQGTRWLNVLKTLVTYRLVDPGSEWRLHRQWYAQNAIGDLLGEDFAVAGKDNLYRCLDKLLAHKQELFSFLRQRWQTLFQADFEILLYDLTSTYFACDPPETGKRRFGHSRDHRSDCVQVVIALIVTPEGFPLTYEVMPGNTSDKTTLGDFLRRIEVQYGKAGRTWVMDRGIPTEAVLTEMRAAKTPTHYLVGTPRARLSQLEQEFLARPWAQVRDSVQVKLIEQDGELYILARSGGRRDKELAIRPIYHQTDARIEAHIFVAFLAYCLQVTLKQRLRALAPGLTPRSVLEKMAAIQMVDMHLPTTDGRTVLLSRYTEPELDQLILLRQLKIDLPAQPSPRIASVDVAAP